MNLLRAASTVSLLTLASRVTGLVREQLIAAAFGASAATDAPKTPPPWVLEAEQLEATSLSLRFLPISATSQRSSDDLSVRPRSNLM